MAWLCGLDCGFIATQRFPNTRQTVGALTENRKAGETSALHAAKFKRSGTAPASRGN